MGAAQLNMYKSLAGLLVVAIFAATCSEASISDPAPEDDFSEIATEEEMISTEVTQGAKNIFGKPLALCSQKGMAMTGFTRNGKCVEQNDDTGSHHICIDLQDTAAAGGNFCKATGQPDWCDQKGRCFGESGMCTRKGWCVCQWAFTGYVGQKTCANVQKLNCDAVNYEALKAYTCADEDAEADGGKVKDALACLKSKCPGTVTVTCDKDDDQAN